MYSMNDDHNHLISLFYLSLFFLRLLFYSLYLKVKETFRCTPGFNNLSVLAV